MHHLGPLLPEVPEVDGVVGRGGEQRALVDQELELDHGGLSLVPHRGVHAGSAHAAGGGQGLIPGV